METILKMMEGVSFFEAFTNEERHQLAQKGHFFEVFRDGDVIIQEGDLNDSALFVILTGTAFVRRDEFKDHIIDYLEAGSVVGEASFLVNGRRRMASVVAQGIVNAFKLDRMALEEFECPFRLKITNVLVTIVVERLERVHEAIEKLMG
ncbi:MAG: cyclic nucleotide-binding domain-containing protein [Magnetococcales bacterium]|nr:cyclic nucleotide-binding domain-containing protein [Magnetococcales bacterium]MBF0151852.1 cyclic nucleotide-binding domain-containing protein [Magnetococcales bacterium]